LIERVRRELPFALLAVISIKPSPAYQGNLAAIQETNARIRELTSGIEKVTYLDVFGKMLQPDGSCRPELFQGDGVHMAPAGYAVWKEVVLAYLNGEGAGFPRQSHRWYSPRLEREIEVLTIGGVGRRILVFPTLYGTPYQYEELGMVEALRERLEGGQLQLFCLDNVDLESFYNKRRAPRERVLRHIRFEQYVLEEVLPFTAWLNANPALTAHGCSLGAFHAVNIAMRHPRRFTQVVAFSGRFDLTRSFGGFADLMDGYYDDDVYFNTPCHYMANLTDPELLAQIRRLDITIAIGESDAFIENNQAFSRILWDKGIWHAFRVYHGYAHSPHRWCEMVKLFL
jgi:esterase/lipase superfamily enzyme